MSAAILTSETVPPVEEQFLDVIYGDTQLLAAEFDAIIAAEWAEPPAVKPGRDAPGRHPGSGPAGRAADRACGPVSRARRADVGGWARQRSPPIWYPTLHPSSAASGDSSRLVVAPDWAGAASITTAIAAEGVARSH